MSDFLQALSRIALSALFIWSGFGKLTAPATTAALLAAKGLPMPKMLAYAAGATEFGLGVLIAVGWQTTVAAAGLAIFTLAATWLAHRYWTMTGEAYRMNQIQALKNLAIVGALLMLAATGPGRFSFGRGR